MAADASGLKKYNMLRKLLHGYNKFRYRLSKKRLDKRLHKEMLAFYPSFYNPGDLVFDIGANMGNRTAVFAESGAKVVAVEPQPDCAKKLTERFGNSIHLESVALGQTEGIAALMISSESTLSTLSKDFIENTSEGRFKNYTWEKQIMVPVTTLDKLIEKYGLPVFCKIDVEGFEPDVLSGLSKRIPVICFEYCVPEMEKSLLKCIRLLSELNPEARFNFIIAENMHLELQEWLPADKFSEYIRTPGFTKTLFGDIFIKN